MGRDKDVQSDSNESMIGMPDITPSSGTTTSTGKNPG
jgi:hypothetical protein